MSHRNIIRTNTDNINTYKFYVLWIKQILCKVNERLANEENKLNK
jgi:hypothetical protein